jgi:hypothetical protein
MKLHQSYITAISVLSQGKNDNRWCAGTQLPPHLNHTQPNDKSQHILPENRVIMTTFKDPKHPPPQRFAARRTIIPICR